MSIETIFGYAAWIIVIGLILIVACQSGFQKSSAGIKDVIDETPADSRKQTGKDDMPFFNADAYAKIQERRAKIAEHEESGKTASKRREALEDRLLAKIFCDLDKIEELTNTETVTYTLKQTGVTITYDLRELTVWVNENEYKYTDLHKWEAQCIYEAEWEQMCNENKMFCETALQYLLPWDSVREEIISGIQAEIEKKEEGRLTEAIANEAAEKEKEKALLSRLGFDPDDPGAYDEAMRSIAM